VKKAWQSFEVEEFKRQQDFEKTILDLPAGSSAKIPSMLTEYTSARLRELYERTGRLMKGLK
jgi:hypothetical protein